MGLIKGGAHPEAARQFMDFILSLEGQTLIATNNVVMPVIPETPLPEAFDMAFRSSTPLLLDKDEIESQGEEWISAWVEQSGL